MGQHDYGKRLRDVYAFLDRHTTGLVSGRPRGNSFFRDRKMESEVARDIAKLMGYLHGDLRIKEVRQMMSGNASRTVLNQLKPFCIRDHSSNATQQIRKLRPELLVDICGGDGHNAHGLSCEIDQVCDHQTDILGIERCSNKVATANFNYAEIRKERLAAGKPTREARYVLGKIQKGGIIEQDGCSTCQPGQDFFTEDMIQRDGARVVLAHRVCNALADHAAEFVVRNGIEYFMILRCCYDKMGDRETMSQVGKQYPLTEGMVSIADLEPKDSFDILSEDIGGLLGSLFSGQMPSTGDPVKRANSFLAHFIRLIPSLDLAAFMEEKGYRAFVDAEQNMPFIVGRKL